MKSPLWKKAVSLALAAALLSLSPGPTAAQVLAGALRASGAGTGAAAAVGTQTAAPTAALPGSAVSIGAPVTGVVGLAPAPLSFAAAPVSFAAAPVTPAPAALTSSRALGIAVAAALASAPLSAPVSAAVASPAPSSLAGTPVQTRTPAVLGAAPSSSGDAAWAKAERTISGIVVGWNIRKDASSDLVAAAAGDKRPAPLAKPAASASAARTAAGVPAAAPVKLSKTTLVGSVAALILPAAGFAGAMYLSWGHGLDWRQLFIMGGMYSITVLGIGIGFHRFFTHRGFKTSKTMEVILGAAGSMSIEGPMSRWVAQHWIHHAHSDQEGDPHSPWLGKPGFWGTLKGAAHSHVGWMFKADHPKTATYVAKIQENKTHKLISDLFPLWAALGVLLPFAVGGLITGTLFGALMAALWGGAARVFLVHHVTFSINSICHLMGAKPFDSKDESRNNGVFGLLAFGEGWHNNHHAFQRSPRHGLEWWQLDISWIVLRMLSKLGLVTEMEQHVPTPAEMDVKRAAGPKL